MNDFINKVACADGRCVRKTRVSTFHNGISEIGHDYLKRLPQTAEIGIFFEALVHAKDLDLITLINYFLAYTKKKTYFSIFFFTPN